MSSAPTKWTLFNSNDEAWDSMLADCRKAKEGIVLEQFIFYKDDFGQKLIDVCAERASAGVNVRFLWDAAGSFSFFGSGIAHDLKEKGIELVFWRTLIPSYYTVPNYRSWLLRNHRRTLVIDEKIGYAGSLCIDDERRNWRDTNVRLDGPVVLSMQAAFDKMWSKATHKRVVTPSRLPHDPEFSYVINSPVPKQKFLYKEMLAAIQRARHSIYITNPYFVPTHRIISALKSAGERGVDVRLIIPLTSNVSAVDIGARSFFDTLLESGVKIYLYEGKLIHSKTMTIDNNWSTVGSMNLDAVSLLYN